MSKVKKVINAPARIVDETLDGFVALSGGAVVREGTAPVLRRAVKREGKVALVIGGGSGHEPMYTAFVGEGFADASVAGEIFAAPSPDQIAVAARAVDAGKGVLFVFGNYAGDVLNFEVATEILADEGIRCATSLVADDAAIADPELKRGIAGAVYQVKLAAWACEHLDTLDEVLAFVETAKKNLATFGVAVRAGSLPHTGTPTFELGDDEIEIGMGMHGERGVKRQKLPPADDLTTEITDHLIAELGLKAGDEIAVLIDNFGSATYSELMIVNRKMRMILEERGIVVSRFDIGAYFTCQEMSGFSLSFLRLNPDLKTALNAPAYVPGVGQFGGV